MNRLTVIDFVVDACWYAIRSPHISNTDVYYIGKCRGMIGACDGERSNLYRYYMEDLLDSLSRRIYDRTSFLYAYGLDFIIRNGKIR